MLILKRCKAPSTWVRVTFVAHTLPVQYWQDLSTPCFSCIVVFLSLSVVQALNNKKKYIERTLNVIDRPYNQFVTVVVHAPKTVVILLVSIIATETTAMLPAILSGMLARTVKLLTGIVVAVDWIYEHDGQLPY